jgi:hypothetical protein
MPLQIRRGTNAERLDLATPFAEGELVYVTDTGKLWIGDGNTLGGVQVTGFGAKDAKDAAAAAFADGTHQNISFSYDEPSGAISATASISTLLGNLNLNNYNITGTGNVSIQGQVSADAFVGSVFPDASSLGGAALVDGIAASINLNGTIKGNVIPGTTTVFDIGSSSYKFKDLYIQNVYGNLTGNTTGYHTGDTKGSLFGQDSTVIVDATEGNVSGNIITAQYISVSSQLMTDNIFNSDSNNTGLEIYSKRGNGIDLNTFNGTQDSPTTTLAGEYVGTVTIKGLNPSSAYVVAGAINAQWHATATLTDEYPISTVSLIAGAGSSDVVQASLSGKTGVLTVPTLGTTVYSVAGTPLPSASTVGAGARAFVSDATVSTFATAYTGGGSNKVPVYSDGTAWHIG